MKFSHLSLISDVVWYPEQATCPKYSSFRMQLWAVTQFKLMQILVIHIIILFSM